MSVRRAARLPAALLVAVLLAGLVGCSALGDGTASGPAAEGATARPAVAAVQVSRILADVGDTAPDALESRLDGSALEVRRAALTVRDAVPTSPGLTPLAGEQLLTAVPEAGPWPRWFLTAVRPTADAVPEVLVLVQAGPRDPYRVTAAATLLPGEELPAPAVAGGVAEPVEPTAAGLAATPVDAVAGYADVLAHGDDAAAAAAYAPDAFRDQVLAEQTAERDGVSEYVEYSVTHTPREGAQWALRTDDGGALVVAVLDGARAFTPRGVGVRQALPPDLAALAGQDTASRGVDIRTAEVVVLHVPASGGSEPVSLVAGSRGTTAVTVR